MFNFDLEVKKLLILNQHLARCRKRPQRQGRMQNQSSWWKPFSSLNQGRRAACQPLGGRVSFAHGLLSAAVLWISAAQINAATVTFDADLLTADVQESSGAFQWLSGSARFWNGSANVAAGADDVVQFGNGGLLSFSAVISLTSQPVGGLRFEAVSGNGYSLAGLGAGQTLTLGSSGLVVNAGAQAVNLGDAGLSLALGAAQTWAHKPGNGALLTVNGSVDNHGHLLTFTSDSSSPVTINGMMTGSGGLTKGAGLNEVSLTNAGNSFTGALTILQGTLTVAGLADSGLGCNGTGAIHLGSGGTSAMLNYVGAGAVLTRAVDLAGTTGGGTLSQSGTGLLKFLGDLTFAVSSTSAKTLTLQGASAGAGEFAGVIRDNPGGGVTQVVKSGSGTWTLSGNNSHTGGTRIESGGTLNLNSASALGTSSLTFGGNATLDNTSGAPITLAAGNGILLNAGSLTFKGSNDLSFGSGGLMISGASRTVTTQAGLLTVGSVNADTALRSLTKSGSGTLVVAGAAGVGFQGGVSVTAGRLRLENALAAGTGAITLSNTSAELEIGGSFAVANALVIGNTGGSKSLRLSAGLSAVYAGGMTIQETTPGDFGVEVADAGRLTLSGRVSGSGAAGLTKLGAGDLVMAGTNDYTGPTLIDGGSLQVGSGGVGRTGTRQVSLNEGALRGSGTVQGTAFTAAAGTTVHVGDTPATADIGTLLFAPVSGGGTFDFKAGSSVILGLAPGQPDNADTLSFSGTGANVLNFQAGLTVEGPASWTPTAPEAFQLLDWSGLSGQPAFDARFQSGSYGGPIAGNGDDNLGFNFPDVSGSGFLWDISSFTLNGSIALVAVPEPSKIMMSTSALACLWLRRRRSE
jgi:autotransporter-associated beta strand protein